MSFFSLLVCGLIIAGPTTAADGDLPDGLRLVEIGDGEKTPYPGPLQISPEGNQIACSEDGTKYVVSAAIDKDGIARPKSGEACQWFVSLERSV